MPPPQYYPPLLNPKKVDYTKIPAHIAWDLNIPLPPYYKFLYFGSHAVGNRGLESFLRRCGGLNYCVQSPSLKCESWAKESYFCYFKQIIENYCVFPPPRYFAYLSVREYMYDDKYKDKFYALIPKSKALYLVRDPVGMLKSYTSYHCRPSFTQIFDFSLNFEDIFEGLVQYADWYYDKDKLHWKPSKQPTLRTSIFRLNQYDMTFHDTDLRKALINIADEDIICIDMSEIIGERAFETTKSLANAFDFIPPKLEDKEKFGLKAGLYEGLLPIKFVYDDFIFYLLDNAYCADDRIYIELGMFVKHSESLLYRDITRFLFEVDSFYGRIIVCILQKDFEALKDNKEFCSKIKSKLLEFIPRLEQQRKIEESKRFSEKDILEYFKSHKDLCLKAKAVFEKHLAFLASVRPDIIESWKYYQEFENIVQSYLQKEKLNETR